MRTALFVIAGALLLGQKSDSWPEMAGTTAVGALVGYLAARATA